MEFATHEVPREAHGCGPAGLAKTPWRRRLQRAARGARAELLTWPRSLRFTVHALEGRTPGGHSLLILYAGNAPYRHYLRRLAFVDQGRELALGRHWLWQLPALAARLGADVRVTRCTKALRGLLGSRQSFYVPEWLWCEIALDPRTPNRSGREWSRILRNNLSFSVTTDPDVLRHFYDRMYLPMIRSSHGEAAQLMGRDDMLARVAANEAELVSVRQGGVAVAGGLVVYENGKARLFSQGVLDADRDLLRQRVGVANYLYSFLHLVQRGFTRVNLGRSRPFLADGVLRFKLERGAELSGATSAGIEIEVLNDGAAASELLCSNPWVAEDAEGLVATFFTAADEPGPRPSAPSGVRRTVVVPVSAALSRRPRVEPASCR